MTTIAIVSPGAMGSALGRCWAAGGSRVVATVAHRSPRTRKLASDLELLPSLADAVAAADVVVSVCPPGAAFDVLGDVIGAASERGVRPLVADVNALAPSTMNALAERAASAGLDMVDGAISGGPPRPGQGAARTVMYLSGPRAGELSGIPASGFGYRLVGEQVGQASGVKMCTASVYKGTHALWLQALHTAQVLGVRDVVLDDLREAYPEYVDGLTTALAVTASKSARFVAEMEQISITQGAAGATPELFEGMAAVYRRLAGTELAQLTPEEAADQSDLESVIQRLVATAGPPPD